MKLRTKVFEAMKMVKRGWETGMFGWQSATGMMGVDVSGLLSTSGIYSRSNRLIDPYSQSVWVMRAIKEISGPISSVPIVFSTSHDPKNRRKTPADDPQLADFWQSPFEYLTFVDGIEATVGWLKLRGESFWLMPLAGEVPFPDVLPGSKMPKVIIARPDRMTPVIEMGEVVVWRYNHHSGRVIALLPEQVVHLRFWNPHNDWRGQSEMDAAFTATEAEFLSGRYARNLMANNADQGAYITSDANLTPEQLEQVKSQLRLKRELAARGEYVPIFLGAAGIKVEDPKVQGMDANVLGGRLQNRHEIAVAFGIPITIFDVKASYSIGSTSDHFRLVHGTCMPTSEKIADGIDQVNLRLFKKQLFAYFDWDEHITLQAVRAERIDAATKLWDRGMPMQVVSDYLRLDLPRYKDWDIGYLPFSVAPVGEPTPTTSPNFSETPPATTPTTIQGHDDPFTRLERLLTMRASGAGDFQSSRPAKEIAQWQSIIAKRRPFIKAFDSSFNRVLHEARTETLQRLDKFKSVRTQETRAVAADIVFDKHGFKSSLTGSMRKISASALTIAGEQLFAEIGKNDPFTMPPLKALQFLSERANRLSNTADEIWDEVKAAITSSVEAGDSIAAMADKIRETFNDISKGRSETIAMTETGEAFSFARHDAMQQAGVTRRSWLTSGNANVRPTHQAANGQVRGIDEPFSVGGYELMHPLDPSGPAKEVINCHCIEVAEPDDSTGD